MGHWWEGLYTLELLAEVVLKVNFIFLLAKGAYVNCLIKNNIFYNTGHRKMRIKKKRKNEFLKLFEATKALSINCLNAITKCGHTCDTQRPVC